MTDPLTLVFILVLLSPGFRALTCTRSDRIDKQGQTTKTTWTLFELRERKNPANEDGAE